MQVLLRPTTICNLSVTKVHPFCVLFDHKFVTVETAVRVLEDDPTFDAGRGSVLNSVGSIEMSAIIMDGSKYTA